MQQFISGLRGIRLGRILITFLVAIAFVIFTAFDKYGNELQAQAEPVTPEATNYQLDRTDSQLRIKNARDTNKNLVDTIREKLELSKPISPEAEQAFEQKQGKASKALNAPQRSLK